jgi:aminopeptidase
MNSSSEQRLTAGIRRFLNDWLQIGEGSPALFVTEDDAAPLMQRLITEATSAGGSHLEVVEASRPFQDIEKMFGAHRKVVYLEGRTTTHGSEVQSYLAATPADVQPTFLRVFDFTDYLFTHGFQASREQLEDVNRRIISKAAGSNALRCRSGSGTDLEIEFDPRFGWIDSCGRPGPGAPGVLPASEVATYSSKVNGVLVADGAVNTNFGFVGDPRLADSPITVQFENSYVREARCDHPLITSLLTQFLAVENADRVGEIGFGTNLGITEFVPMLSHINERFPTLHIGLGGNNQGAEIVGWQCPLHFDLILGKCTLTVDGSIIHADSEYILDALQGTEVPAGIQIGYVDTL